MKSDLDELLRITQLFQHDCPPSHDSEHIRRVCRSAETLGKEEGADLDILLPAALLHDLVVYPKRSNKTLDSANDSANIAYRLLRDGNYYSTQKIEQIVIAIRAHSYSRNQVPNSLEGKILQDADRLDAIGAIGVARTFSVGGTEKRSFYNPTDPLGELNRELNDTQWTLDHIKKKLLKLKNSMHTKTAKKIALQRTIFIESFLIQLRREILE